MSALKSSTPDRFEEDQYLKVEKYTKEFQDLSERIKKLEDSMGSETAIAATFCSVSETQIKMRSMISNVLVDLIKKEDDVKTEIKNTLDKIDRNFVYSGIKRVGGWVGAVLLLVIGALVNQWFGKK